jgi:hypothetical protein
VQLTRRRRILIGGGVVLGVLVACGGLVLLALLAIARLGHEIVDADNGAEVMAPAALGRP